MSRISLVTLVVLLLSLPALAQEDPKLGSVDVFETISTSDALSTLESALEVTGLAETLKGEGPYTLLAPTNGAFARFAKGPVEDLFKPENMEMLTAILKYHIVPGKVSAIDIISKPAVKTLHGSSVSLSAIGGKIMVNDARVTLTDVPASNGVIHIIDTVIQPKK